MSHSTSLPVLDISAYLNGDQAALLALGAQLREISETVGFFYLKGHGLGAETFQRMTEQVAYFHALPLEEKTAIRLNEHKLGYLAMHETLSKVSSIVEHKPNINAAFIVGRERAADDPDVLSGERYRGLNQWPAGHAEFRAHILNYIERMDALAKAMLPIWATALELPPDHFDAFFERAQYLLRMTHYPAREVEDKDQYSLAPHTDNSFMTLLPQANEPGLAVLMPSGEWLEIPIIEDWLVVNSGNLMVRWSNDRFLSTKHRVVNRSGRNRYAFPFFYGPHPDTAIEALPTCVGPEKPPAYEPIRYQDLMAWYFQK